MSFVLVLVSCTAVELMLDRSSLRLECAVLVRWVALPALAMLALYVNLSTTLPSTVTQHVNDQGIRRSHMAVPTHAGRRVADRPLLTAGAILTAI
jgi:hypothetical protein